MIEAQPGVGDRAIAEQHAFLDQEPDCIDGYRALHALYLSVGARDQVWCVASAISFLERAKGARRSSVAHRPERGLPRSKWRLDDERWLKDLRHPAQDPVVSKIFQQIWPAVLSQHGKTDKDAGLHVKYRVDPDTHGSAFARAFGAASTMLGLSTPRLFLRSDVRGGITHLPVYPLGSLFGATLLDGFTPTELMFAAGRHLSDYRGEHYVRTLMPSGTELERLFLAALRIGGIGPSDARIDALARMLLPKLQPAQIEVLTVLARSLVEAGAQVDVQVWLRSVELTACRAGLLVCNDLDAACRMTLALGACAPLDVAGPEKARQLVRFCASEPYFRLRRALSIEGRAG